MRYVIEYGMKYDMRYDLIWDHMMWHMSDMELYDVIYTVGKKGKLAVIFAHSVCCVWCVASVCVCVSGGWVGGCGVSKTVHGHLGSFNLFKCHHRGDVWIIPYLIRGNMLHVEHISCVITDCDQQQWVIPFLSPYLFMSCWSKSLSENHYLKNCFSKVGPSRCFLCILFGIFSPYFHLVGLLL